MTWFSALSLADASGYEAKFLSAARLNIQFLLKLKTTDHESYAGCSGLSFSVLWKTKLQGTLKLSHWAPNEWF